MVDAVKNARRDLSREKLVGALESLHEHDLGGYRIDYGPASHNGSHFVDMTVIGQNRKGLR